MVFPRYMPSLNSMTSLCLSGFLAALLVFAAHGRAQTREVTHVLLLPLEIHAVEEHHPFLKRGLQSMLESRLLGEGLAAVSQRDMERILTEDEMERGAFTQDRAETLALQAGVDYVIFGSVTALAGAYSLDLSLVDLSVDPAGLTRVSQSATESELIPQLSEAAYRLRVAVDGYDPRAAVLPHGTGEPSTSLGLFFRQEGGTHDFEPTGHTSLRMRVLSFDAADLNGDGETELLILGRERLVVARRVGDTLSELGRFSATRGEEFLKVSAGDMDRDGRAEIFVSSLYGERVQSRVLTWAPGGFREFMRAPGHLVAVRNADTGRSMLLFQESRQQLPFFGPIRIVNLADGKRRIDTEFALDRMGDAQIYTLACADVTRNGVHEFIGLNERSRLTVWSADGTPLWNGDRSLGGSNTFVRLGEGRSEEGDRDRPRSDLNSRLVLMDIDGDHRKEVLAAHNIATFGVLDHLRHYQKSRMLAYSVTEGPSLASNWTSRRINYAVADMQAHGGTLYIAGNKGELSQIGEGSSRIMWFEK